MTIFKKEDISNTSTTLLFLVGNLLAYDDDFLKNKLLLDRLGVATSINGFLGLPDYAFAMIENPDLPTNWT
jgi:hypothetical protein